MTMMMPCADSAQRLYCDPESDKQRSYVALKKFLWDILLSKISTYSSNMKHSIWQWYNILWMHLLIKDPILRHRNISCAHTCSYRASLNTENHTIPGTEFLDINLDLPHENCPSLHRHLVSAQLLLY